LNEFKWYWEKAQICGVKILGHTTTWHDAKSITIIIN
jgi:hypothetical protein